MTQAAIKAYLASIGAKGGKKKSAAKIESVKANLIEARKKRWLNRKPRTKKKVK